VRNLLLHFFRSAAFTTVAAPHSQLSHPPRHTYNFIGASPDLSFRA
jgi:hypothetical protein